MKTQMQTKVATVKTQEEMKQKYAEFCREGYAEDRIYVLTHDKDRTKRIAEKTDLEEIGVAELGIGTTLANIFRSTGDELRAKMRSLGISQWEAERLEREMDRDAIIVIAWAGHEYHDDDYDHDVFFYPYVPYDPMNNQPPYK